MSTRPPTRTLPPAMAHFQAWMLGLGLLSFVYTAVMTHVLHSQHLYGVTLFHGAEFGSDFRIFAERSHHFLTSSYWDPFNYPFTYPAPLAIVFALCYKLPHPFRLYECLCVAGLATWATWLARRLGSLGPARALGFVLTALLFSWPVVCLLNTANIEGLVAILLAAGVACTLYGRPWLGATLLGLAGSMKLFPFALLAVLLSQRRYRQFAWAWIVAALTTLASLALLGPTIPQAQRHIADGLRFVKVAFIFSTTPDSLNYSHSLFSLIKFAFILAWRAMGHPANPLHEDALLDIVLRIYFVAATLAGLALYTLVLRTLPMLNQLLALTVCAVLLPPLSSDYTLLQLLFPFGLFCVYAMDCRQHGINPTGLRASFLCFAGLFGWATFLTLGLAPKLAFDRAPNLALNLAFDRPMRCLVLCLLLALVSRHPFPWPELDAAPETAREAL